MTSETNPGANPELAALKNQVFTLLMALIVVSGTLTIFLYRQSSLTGSDLAQAKQLNVMITQNETALNTFITQLVAYGEKHPDFVPVLKKYGIAPQPGVPAGAVAPVAPKK
jgi:hypothetical protein